MENSMPSGYQRLSHSSLPGPNIVEEENQAFQIISEHSNLNALCISSEIIPEKLKTCIRKPTYIEIRKTNILIPKTWYISSNWKFMTEQIKRSIVLKMANESQLKDLLAVVTDGNALGTYIARRIVKHIQLETCTLSWGEWLCCKGCIMLLK